jgi:hypothetical protein
MAQKSGPPPLPVLVWMFGPYILAILVTTAIWGIAHLFKLPMVVTAFAVMVAMIVIAKVKPFPFDRGHRCFIVKDEEAAATIVGILSQHGLKPVWTFDSAPTHQILLNDNTTVIMWPDPGSELVNAISIPVANPSRAAEDAANTLTMLARYESRVSMPIPELENDLFLVTTSAAPTMGLVFRKTLMAMPKPAVRPTPRRVWD